MSTLTVAICTGDQQTRVGVAARENHSEWNRWVFRAWHWFDSNPRKARFGAEYFTPRHFVLLLAHLGARVVDHCRCRDRLRGLHAVDGTLQFGKLVEQVLAVHLVGAVFERSIALGDFM